MVGIDQATDAGHSFDYYMFRYLEIADKAPRLLSFDALARNRPTADVFPGPLR